jgi:hypothetical protein
MIDSIPGVPEDRKQQLIKVRRAATSQQFLKPPLNLQAIKAQ